MCCTHGRGVLRRHFRKCTKALGEDSHRTIGSSLDGTCAVSLLPTPRSQDVDTLPSPDEGLKKVILPRRLGDVHDAARRN